MSKAKTKKQTAKQAAFSYAHRNGQHERLSLDAAFKDFLAGVAWARRQERK